jgi:nicotinate-nucleotide adenylyltransferase
MRIGILGGTFDPPHNGHLAIARAATSGLELEEVMFMPAARNPLKTGRKPASARDRLEMVKLLIAKEPSMSVSDIDITRGGRSYAVDTLEELQVARPAEYWFLMGADALHDLPAWKQPEKLIKMCRIGAVVRDSFDVKTITGRWPVEYQAAVDPIPMEKVDISSTDLRERSAKGRLTSLFLPEAVRQYIEQHKLYRN